MDISSGSRADHSSGSHNGSMSSLQEVALQELQSIDHLTTRVAEMYTRSPGRSPISPKSSVQRSQEMRRRMREIQEDTTVPFANNDNDESIVEQPPGTLGSSTRQQDASNSGSKINNFSIQQDEEESAEHDQLPGVEDYKASQGISTTRAFARFTIKCILCTACCIVLASVLIAVGVVIGRDEVILEEEGTTTPASRLWQSLTRYERSRGDSWMGQHCKTRDGRHSGVSGSLLVGQ